MELRKKSPKIQPFIEIRETDSLEEIREKFRALADMGITSAILQYASSEEKKQESGGIYPFDQEYFETLKRMSLACRELGMTYWVQDAAPFPTGAANGAFGRPEYFEKGKLYLEERHTHVRGPVQDAELLVENFNGLPAGGIANILHSLNRKGPELTSRAKLLGVAAVPAGERRMEFDADQALELTDCVDWEEGVLKFDLPEGNWRVFFLYETHIGSGRKFYMNLLDDESVRIQMEEVHKLHYEKMKEELGATWEGFFYDEPEIGNTGGYDFDCLPGYRKDRASITLPWSKELPKKLKERLGEAWMTLLPCLWYDCGEKSRLVRYHYMDTVTRLIQENYNGQVLPWCRERGISYIGHVLEDENSHARLGCGTGHFFRMERHQDMAGVDLIGGQLRPGMDMPGIPWYGSEDGDGEFYHYGLCKLASSEAHINPGKEGNSFCEVNAVYQELSNGRYYKFLLDHLFVSGINHLVPVITDALSKAEGALLFPYGERMCRMLEASQAVVPAAVLYHGEAEWAGDTMYFQTPGAILARNQIDYDVIPGDALTEREFYGTRILPGRFVINHMEYRALIVPRCRYIRRDVLETILKLREAGVKVFFVEELPEGYCEELGEIDWKGETVPAVPLHRLAEELWAAGIFDIRCSGCHPWLRYSHWRKDGHDYYMFLNADERNRLTTTVTFPESERIWRLDVGKQWMEEMMAKPGNVSGNGPAAEKGQYGGRRQVSLTLGCLESTVFVLGSPALEDAASVQLPGAIGFREMKLAAGRNLDVEPDRPMIWSVEYQEGDKVQRMELKDLQDLGVRKGMQRFTGELIYRTKVDFGKELPGILDLGEAGDSAHVFINGTDLGMEIAAPYLFDIFAGVREGVNEIEIRVQPSKARGVNTAGGFDLASLASPVTYTCMPRTGLIGPVTWR